MTLIRGGFCAVCLSCLRACPFSRACAPRRAPRPASYYPQVPLTTSRVRITVGTGTAKYVPEHNAIVWKVRRFGGGSEVVFNGEIELITTTSLKAKPWVRPPIAVDFQVPMFTASGLHVRSLKIYERSNYESTKWVRYLTRSGGEFAQRRARLDARARARPLHRHAPAAPPLFCSVPAAHLKRERPTRPRTSLTHHTPLP